MQNLGIALAVDRIMLRPQHRQRLISTTLMLAASLPSLLLLVRQMNRCSDTPCLVIFMFLAPFVLVATAASAVLGWAWHTPEPGQRRLVRALCVLLLLIDAVLCKLLLGL